MANYKNLLIETQGETMVVSINRPDVLNALNLETINELTDVTVGLRSEPKIRVLVLRSSGEKAFVAGADIGAMSKLNPESAREFATSGQQLTLNLESLPQVVIARVQGFALGGGCELAMACDIVIASERAKFGQPEVGLGLIAGFGGTQRLVRRVGMAVAMDILIGGRTITGVEAAQLGLISRCCPAERLDEEVNISIKRILKNGPSAIACTKQLVRSAYHHNLSDGLVNEANAFSQRFELSETTEGMSAFLEKRSATFAR